MYCFSGMMSFCPQCLIVALLLLPQVNAFYAFQGSPRARVFLKAEEAPGMNDAFRQLDALKSLNDGDPVQNPPTGFKDSKVSASAPTSASSVPPEKEVEVYKNMMDELENSDDLYSDVLADMGGLSAPSGVSQEMIPPSEENTDRFMNMALKEAVKEVKASNQSPVVDSVLNDKEIMKEIEAIFERGNEKLLESLEEIRKEQRELAQASAERNAEDAIGALDGDAARLAQAEASMEAMLKKVNKETAEVERAVRELQEAQAELDKDFVVRLKKGGLPKQAALAGLLLFSVRSIVDSVTAGGDESQMSAALIQGAIAIACAAYFFIVQ